MTRAMILLLAFLLSACSQPPITEVDCASGTVKSYSDISPAEIRAILAACKAK